MTLCSKDCIDRLMFDNAEPSNRNSNCQRYGNNRYAYSAIRQCINSDKPAEEWWASQHSADAAPNYATTKDGFLTRLDPNFLAVISKTKIKVAKNGLSDGEGTEELEDYFYLPSVAEMGYDNDGGIAEGVNFP